MNEEIVDNKLKLKFSTSKDIRDNMPIWEIIKKNVSIEQIYPKRLKKEGDHFRGNCTLHKNTDSPSFRYFPFTETWNCFSCGTGGDVISLYQHINNLNRVDAIKNISKDFKIEFTKKDKDFLNNSDKVHKLFIDFLDKCVNNPNFNIYKKKIAEKRGFTNKTIDNFKIGLYDDEIKEYIEEKYSDDLLIKAGFKKRAEKGNSIYWIFGKRIVYPYLNIHEEPEYFIYRIIDDEPDFHENAKYIKQRRTEFVKEIPFGINYINKIRENPLIITEGITDAISVIQAGFCCLSPVTVRIKHEDIKKMISYCKRYDKVYVINDNEEHKIYNDGELKNIGLEGAKTTLEVLMQNNIECYISIIPNPDKKEKIDLDDFLKPDLDNIEETKINNVIELRIPLQKEKINNLINNSIYGWDYFISTLNETTKQEDIETILNIIPDDDLVLIDRIIDKIKYNTKLKKKIIEKLYNKVVEDRHRREVQEYELQKSVESGDDDIQDDVLYRFYFNNREIEIRKTGIYKIYEKYNERTDEMISFTEMVFRGRFEIDRKSKDDKIDVFSFLHRDNYYQTMIRTKMLGLFEPFTYKSGEGKDIIKEVISFYADKLEYSEAKYIIGFDNGWVLPQLEKKNDYSIILYTSIQKQIYERCNHIYKHYKISEKKLIVNDLKKLLLRTQIDKYKLATVLGWSMASPFRLSFIYYYKLFPAMSLIGPKESGKTFLASFFSIEFFRVWKNYMSSSTATSPARLEDCLSTSTFPIQIDEFEKVYNHLVVEILKETLTGVTDYKRKLNVLEEFNKPKVAPFIITANFRPKAFEESALNSKMINISFSSEEKIKDDQVWIDLYNKLKKEKLFSFIYEYTIDWDNNKIIEIIKDIENIIRKQSFYIELELDKNSRLRKKFISVLFGLHVFKETFNIDVFNIFNIDMKGILLLIEESVRAVTLNLLDQFVEFCIIATKFGKDDYNIKYRTCLLRKSKTTDEYYFTPANLRDFNEFASGKYSMSNLGDLLNDSLENKELIRYKRTNFDGKQARIIRIKSDALENGVLFNEKREIDVKDVYIPFGKNKQLEKFDIFFSQLKEMYEDNKYIDLEKDGIISVLELNDELTTEYITNAIDTLIEEGLLSESKKGVLKYVERM